MESGSISAFIGAERFPSATGNGKAAPSRPNELGRGPARTRRAPLPRGAGAFSPDAPLTTNPPFPIPAEPPRPAMRGGDCSPPALLKTASLPIDLSDYP